MAKVWNMDNLVKFHPSDVRRYDIYEPGKPDFSKKDAPLLEQWQVKALMDVKMPTGPAIFIGYYPSKDEAVQAVDALDAMAMAEMVDSVDELLRKEPENDLCNCNGE